MFSVLYLFKVKEGKEIEFVQSWKSLTQLIYQFEGSFGSKLHKDTHGNYIAYAAWPNKETWENSGSNLPEEANEFGELMRDSCSIIDTEYELEEVKDLIKSHPFEEN